MKEGAMILMDEISLADDSVLERLNSVLEPERRLLLAEKGGGDGKQNDVEEITAAETFQILATMNPGGDYGKKEVRLVGWFGTHSHRTGLSSYKL
jgi:midasin